MVEWFGLICNFNFFYLAAATTVGREDGEEITLNPCIETGTNCCSTGKGYANHHFPSVAESEGATYAAHGASDVGNALHSRPYLHDNYRPICEALCSNGGPVEKSISTEST